MNVLIAGDGNDAELLLSILRQHKKIKIIGLMGSDDESPEARHARQMGIPTGADFRTFSECHVDVIIDVTSDSDMHKWLNADVPKDCEIICGKAAMLLLELVKRLRDDNVQMEALLTDTERSTISD